MTSLTQNPGFAREIVAWILNDVSWVLSIISHVFSGAALGFRFLTYRVLFGEWPE